MAKEYTFALDIGTRTVIGLLCRLADSGEVAVEHYHVEWHPQRAMLDGQIHDVEQVSAVIRRIKEALEEKAGVSLKTAAIAAAGRALTTQRVKERLEFAAPQEVEFDDVQRLELKALASAREEMERKTTSLHCVGFSPVSYFLDNLPIANPRGQRGSSIGVEIIATFLPRVVVDGLYSSLAKAGLAVDSMTLEPIAAMAVAIPPPLRLLNLALADVGAGTSDIAVSRDGTIISYGMVDMAGDEVTEAIAQHYLLDFNSAEKVKIQLGNCEEIEFTDVLGNNLRESREAILAVIEPVVDKLAKKLSETIKQNNGGISPAALFCVGGGSLTPMLREEIARQLDLPLERVGIRTREHLEGVLFPSNEFTGPDIITPLGIAMTAIRPREENYIRIWLNDQGVTLFNVQKATVSQALMQGGIDISSVAGSGSVLAFELNGNTREIAGAPGQAGKILVNDIAATLDTPLIAGDRVDVIPGKPGAAPEVTNSQLAAEFQSPRLLINSSWLELPLVMKINNLPCQPDTLIRPGDKVEIRPPASVGELATLMDLDLRQVTVTVDGTEADSNTPVDSKSAVNITAKHAQQEHPATPVDDEIHVTVNGTPVTLQKDRSILAYALAKADIKHTGAVRGNLVITVNGIEAEYTALLNTGDRVEVFWAPKE
ncbi:MAG: cell division protein FtsA [Firmicutes bacterium]|nr:cell division protein FtsA [Bacillota bacterium]